MRTGRRKLPHEAAVSKCPQCNQPIRHERFGLYLPRLKASIVDAIEGAGPAGITPHEIIARCWPRREKTDPHTVDAHVWQLNDLFRDRGVQIVVDRGKPPRFRLARDTDDGRASA